MTRAPAKPKTREVVRVPTDFGPIAVTIVGNRASKAKIVTYHDMCACSAARSRPRATVTRGTFAVSDHRGTFNAFFQLADQDEVLRQFSVYHIDAPGHETGAEERHRRVRMHGAGLAPSSPAPRSTPTPDAIPVHG